ncbi:MAG: preprotein translocase subunit SecA [Rubripirellula sp.]
MIGAWTALFGQSSEQTVKAKQKASLLGDRSRIDAMVAQTRMVASSLRNVSSSQLREHGDRLGKMGRGIELSSGTLDRDQQLQYEQLMVLAIGGMTESIRRNLSLELFDTQIFASLVVGQGAIAEMQTGEGKTLAVAAAVYFKSLHGRGVHVATPNDYLARRDQAKLQTSFASLGASTAVVDDKISPQQRRDAYSADVTYAAGHTFGFDYLRDQVLMGDPRLSGLGHSTLARLTGNGPAKSMFQRGLRVTIVDEIDHVLIDDAVSPLLLSAAGAGDAVDEEIHREAFGWAGRLVRVDSFVVTPNGKVELTDEGLREVYQHTEMVMHESLLRPWHEYVVLALRAKYCYQRDVDYIVCDDEVRIADASTGRIHADRSWSGGLHQAIQVREGLPVQPETRPIARITRQTFYRNYSFVGGMTGTVDGCHREFASVYGLPVVSLSPRVPSRRQMFPACVVNTRSEKLASIVDETETIVRSGRAVLIGTLSIAASHELAGAIEARGLQCQLLNGVQDQDEAAIISDAGKIGAITVATNLAGRGTDIVVDDSVLANGGLHVIACDHHLLARVDRQLVGRSARCGDPGSARFFVASDDCLVADHAPWVSRAIKRWDRDGRAGDLTLEESIARVQQKQQRQQSASRMQLMRSDQHDERLLERSSGTPRGCVEL